LWSIENLNKHPANYTYCNRMQFGLKDCWE